MGEPLSFADIDGGFADFLGATAGWRDSGLDALLKVCEAQETFTSSDVWAAWQGPTPEEGRRMAEILQAGIEAGWCRRIGVVAGHTRRSGNAGFGSAYRSLRRARVA